jgi:nucleoside-diphosphate-sugar epimerase
MRVLVTGASGFVGRALCVRLAAGGMEVVGAVRNKNAQGVAAKLVAVGDIHEKTDWSQALQGVATVIHLAARVHVMKDGAQDPLAAFRRVNTAGTAHLARCAAAGGVRRLVYVSSIKVNGEETRKGKKFSEADPPAPLDPYGVSKWEAEQALYKIADESGMEIVIVRPPLVYGPGVKGNFLQMLGALKRGIPLPFAAVQNRRSLIYVENLADALSVCATHPAAADQTYLVCDGEDVATPDLLRQLAAGMGLGDPLFYCPPGVLRLLAKLVGKSQQIERLLGDLQLDGDRIRAELNWTPPYTLRQGLQTTAQWYLARHTP